MLHYPWKNLSSSSNPKGWLLVRSVFLIVAFENVVLFVWRCAEWIMNKGLRFGLIGCGSFGVHLGEYLLEVGQIAAVCDVDRQRAEDTAKELALDVPVFTDYAELIKECELDAVAIAAANFVHCEIACAAAQAGLHIYCEKAMAVNLDECWKMVNAAQQNNVKLMVGHKRRLRISWSRMIELTSDECLGQPLAMSVTQYADMRPYEYPGTWWSDPKLSGGPFALLGVHVLDWFRAMCGDVECVSAQFGPQIESGYNFPDVVHALYRFRSGALATINTSFMYPLARFREAQGPTVQCRNGGFKLVPEMETIHLYWKRLDESDTHHEEFSVPDDFPPAYRREIGDFAAWITEDRKPCMTWEEGLRCVEMMEAAYRSAEIGGQRVDFPLKEETS